MNAEDVTHAMLLEAGYLGKGALLPKKSAYAERDRLTALDLALASFMRKQAESAQRFTSDFKSRIAEMYEATHGEQIPPHFWGSVSSASEAAVLEHMWEARARREALEKSCAREAINRDLPAVKRRRQRVILATPPWVDYKAIAALFRKRAAKIRATGVDHEIDHIVPLAGKLVCGLHWHGNMQVITRLENRRKKAGFRPGVDGIYGMP